MTTEGVMSGVHCGSNEDNAPVRPSVNGLIRRFESAGGMKRPTRPVPPCQSKPTSRGTSVPKATSPAHPANVNKPSTWPKTSKSGQGRNPTPGYSDTNVGSHDPTPTLTLSPARKTCIEDAAKDEPLVGRRIEARVSESSTGSVVQSRGSSEAINESAPPVHDVMCHGNNNDMPTHSSLIELDYNANSKVTDNGLIDNENNTDSKLIDNNYADSKTVDRDPADSSNTDSEPVDSNTVDSSSSKNNPADSCDRNSNFTDIETEESSLTSKDFKDCTAIDNNFTDNTENESPEKNPVDSDPTSNNFTDINRTDSQSTDSNHVDSDHTSDNFTDYNNTDINNADSKHVASNPTSNNFTDYNSADVNNADSNHVDSNPTSNNITDYNSTDINNAESNYVDSHPDPNNFTDAIHINSSSNAFTSNHSTTANATTANAPTNPFTPDPPPPVADTPACPPVIPADNFHLSPATISKRPTLDTIHELKCNTPNTPSTPIESGGGNGTRFNFDDVTPAATCAMAPDSFPANAQTETINPNQSTDNNPKNTVMDTSNSETGAQKDVLSRDCDDTDTDTNMVMQDIAEVQNNAIAQCTHEDSAQAQSTSGSTQSINEDSGSTQSKTPASDSRSSSTDNLPQIVITKAENKGSREDVRARRSSVYRVEEMGMRRGSRSNSLLPPPLYGFCRRRASTCAPEVPPPQLRVHGPEDEWSEQRTVAINDALGWIKAQLADMRSEDHELARTLLALRSGIREVKLQRCCDENREALDTAMDDADDEDDQHRLLTDFVPGPLSPMLKDIGLTKMNITIRRFSVF